jgi:uncharacterized protein YdeI (YjbR/CyaY-like superfamily)
MPEQAVYFKTPSEWRNWLEEFHDKAIELLVGFYKKGSGKPSITWPESVDEALCFGWIDGVRKGVDEERYTIRFTPRKKSSIWSAVNIKRVGELTEAGLMRPTGLAAFEKRKLEKSVIYSHEQKDKIVELDEESEQKLRSNPAAWDFFQSQAPSYRKAVIWWVLSAKREETKLKRLATLIQDSEQKLKIPQFTWAKKEK